MARSWGWAKPAPPARLVFSVWSRHQQGPRHLQGVPPSAGAPPSAGGPAISRGPAICRGSRHQQGPAICRGPAISSTALNFLLEFFTRI